MMCLVLMPVSYSDSPGGCVGTHRPTQVNTKVALRLMAEAGAAAAEGDVAAAKGSQRAAAAAANPLADSRFSAMFEDPDFTIDEEAEDYRLLHPNAARDQKNNDEALLREHFEEIASGSEDTDDDDGDGADDDSLDEMDEQPTEARAARSAGSRKPNSKRLPDRRTDADGGQGPPAKRAKKDAGPAAGPSMFAARDATAAEAFRRGESLALKLNQPLADRLATEPAAAPSRRLGGSREVSFVPRGGGGGGGGRRG
ncbi:hypothetical protein Vafri_1208, partial [Volvox africanus]